jgi:hypothetical protein
MSAVGEAAGPRPNPFAMPSATAVRFALLAIATSRPYLSGVAQCSVRL